MKEVVCRSARSLARAILNKEFSSKELVAEFLNRIETVNPRLNTVVQITAEEALKQASEADKLLARGETIGPLHGVPITIKDSIDTANVPTTWGTRGRTDFIPAQDATVVDRVRKAGAIILGKTNTPEFTLSFETDNPIYGRTNNPYNLDATPGGSSGGEAAIIAACGSPVGLGSDTGGSIRVPSHFCGLAGLKPSSGRVPRTGHAIPPGSLVDSFTQIGPIARYVEDLAMVLPIIAGEDGSDPHVVPMPLNDPGKVDFQGMRAAVLKDNGIVTPDPETIEAVVATASVLSDAGFIVEEDRLAGIEETFDIYSGLLFGWDGGL